MAIKLKTRVALGGIFLFVLLLLAGAVSFFYFNRVSRNSGEIVKDNYESLNYCRGMLAAIDQFKTADSTEAYKRFDQILSLEEKNITEPGEGETAEQLRAQFEDWRAGTSFDAVSMRRSIDKILQLNLAAIGKKNQQAKSVAVEANTIITISLTICFLLGFTFLFNFPSLIAAPLASLKEAIGAVAAKDYSHRLVVNRKDEFGELAAALNSMAEKLDEYEHSNLSKILFEKRRAEAVINSLKDASIGIDSKGIVLFANEQALQLLALKEKDIVGLSRDDIQKRNDLFRFLVTATVTAPFRIVVNGKENFFTRENIELLHEGKPAGNVIMLKNITPFKELDAAKTNFIATISHELKTPLSSADFSLKLLDDERVGPLNQEQKQLVASIMDDNRRLLRILSELLDMSQVESGRINIVRQPVDPKTILTQSITAVEKLAREKNITIATDMPPELPGLQADGDKTGWVLNNFLTNAIRYSASGATIRAGIGMEPTQLRFWVQDFGPGIQKEYVDRVFDKYFRMPGTTEGTGLGLAICKDFIEAQQGTIGVESEPGKGSRFYFTLPL